MKQNATLKQDSVQFITQAAVIAALYVILSIISEALGLCSGVIQCRISEALTILPAFFASAIPGLYIGCLLTNVIASATAWDIVFGPVATLVGALGTYLIGRVVRSRALRKSENEAATGSVSAPRIVVLTIMFALPPIIANAVIIPPILKFGLNLEDAFWFIVATVTAGEVIACGIFGGLLLAALLRNAYTRKLLAGGSKAVPEQTPDGTPALSATE